ncbi:LysR substrate-binding domain-containing protein [Achromobacter deleyi]|uniref:LysR substrate-binding domain-containing protein n=1 Tax=Achromobacter deleyi TaxID=1353891 RepID=UPI001466B50C|nr:LysR substrate-binding domain-containing protein [Achromobacter deleyi]CAB3838008.1 Hca operon transcriptional activator HcaR [Achromobacter deleyi]
MPLISRALRAFVVVAEELHFGNAAARLNISQPPLSQLIRQFEAQVGAELFVRSTRSVKLTRAGEVLLQHARRLLAEGDAAVHAARRAGSGDAGRLTVGFVSTAAYQVLPPALSRYRAEYPDVELALEHALTGELADKLAAGTIDLAIFRRLPRAEEPDFVYERVHREKMILALPADHPLNRYERVPMARLDGQDVVGFQREASFYFHSVQTRLFRDHNVRPHIVYESVLPTLLSMVECGMGVALVPESAATLRGTGVQYRPLSGRASAFDVDLYCARRADNLNPTAQAFARVLRESTRDATREPPAR